MKSATEPVQDVSAVAFAAPVKKSVERWVGDTGLLLKFVARPALISENFLQFADDHKATLEQLRAAVNTSAYI